MGSNPTPSAKSLKLFVFAEGSKRMAGQAKSKRKRKGRKGSDTPRSERFKKTARKLGAETGEVLDVAVETLLKQTAAHIRESAKK